jgi:hypothetical protein
MNIDGPELEAAAPILVQEQPSPESKHNNTKADGEISEADAARSAENIRLWRSYLPKDCVDMMIKMGWDLSV